MGDVGVGGSEVRPPEPTEGSDATLDGVHYVVWLAHHIVAVVRDNRGWMTWNLALAVLPALLAVALFPHRGRRGAMWWAGVAAFVLLLPNAPYVITDLIHLREARIVNPSRGLLAFGLLPIFGTFVVAGYLAYLFAMDRIVDEVRTRSSVARWTIELVVHAVCSVGIVLGRVARLNSWDTVTSPTSTIERTFSTIAWSGAPMATLAVFVAIVLTYSTVRAAVVVLGMLGDRIGRSLDLITPVT